MSVTDKTLITDGPSLLHLLVSLAEPNKSPAKAISFFSGQYNQYQVCITLLAKHKGGDEQFHFEGWWKDVPHGNIHGVYCARTRKGWFGRGHIYSEAAGLK